MSRQQFNVVEGYVPLTTIPVSSLITDNSIDITGKNDNIAVEDEGGVVVPMGALQYINFKGAGVTAAISGGNTVDVTIPGGGGGGGGSLEDTFMLMGG
jgi:hypothetical protein